MISSMTGFGQAENDAGEEARIKVEMRSVNHRYLDIAIRTPREIQSLEDRIRRQVQQAFGRGRVDVFVSWRDQTEDAASVVVDRALLRAYQHALEEMREFCSLAQTPDLELLTRFPDILRVEKAQVDMDEVWERLGNVLAEAIINLITQRQEEGARLYKDFMMRLETVTSAAAQVEARAPQVVEENRKKLEERMNEYLGQADIDPARLLTEAALFADRSNVTEELVRLASHITGFKATLKEKGPIGRKLDFVTQELFRETNTIGSKANDYEVAKLVVEMKTELEKIREQVQNIE